MSDSPTVPEALNAELTRIMTVHDVGGHLEADIRALISTALAEICTDCRWYDGDECPACALLRSPAEPTHG